MSPGGTYYLTASESTRGPHTYGVEQRLLCGPMGRKRHHALPTKTYRAVKSPEDQSSTGQKSSFGNTYQVNGYGKARAVAGWAGQYLWNTGQQWLGQKHGSEQLIRPLLLLPPAGIYAWTHIRQWEPKNLGLEGIVDNTGKILAEKRGHSNTCLSYWPWMFYARHG